MGVAPLPQTSPIGRSPIIMAVFFPYILSPSSLWMGIFAFFQTIITDISSLPIKV